MSRIIKDAAVKRYPYASHDEFRLHRPLFVDAFNGGRWRKVSAGHTLCKSSCPTRTKEPERFRRDPEHHMLGPNIKPRAGSPRLFAYAKHIGADNNGYR